ncbi:MAG: diaminopimelate epimerase [Rickettsiaceae bacterium]|nr:MAG: diaminopimelate epimerase [Rickettsiaceae bacterium]
MWIPFVKMHGLGNSFIIVEQRYIKDIDDISLLARNLLNSNIGLSGDQFIVYKQLQNSTSDYEIWIYNPDGSLAKACGNGTRCLAKLIHNISNSSHITIKVSNRIITCIVNNNDEISVNMGKAILSAAWMPSISQINFAMDRYNPQSKKVTCVDMGNRHIVVFDLADNIDKQIFASELSRHNLFFDSIDINNCNINVNLARIDQEQGKIYLQTYERNTGFTLACGSGACASFAAARKLSLLSNYNIVEVVFKLGSLLIEQKNEDIIMTGPTNLVARGELNYNQ